MLCLSVVKIFISTRNHLHIGTMNGENHVLVTSEPVELRNNWLRFKTSGYLPIILEEFIEYASN